MNTTSPQTIATSAGPMEAGKRYLIAFDAGEEDDSGTIDGIWIGEQDYVGKLTIRDTFGGPISYLFPFEIFELSDPDDEPDYHPQFSADDFMKLPPGNWDRIISALKESERITLSGQLLDRSTAAAAAAGYVQARKNGDSHAKGVKAFNRVLMAVRKALGYTYPRQDVNF